ncbi:hypothetical protein [Mucilaginibacter ginkgonis]|uniref:Uncharacterized protein n=1 Tax=Mucilaginibacter ginkgonis TaxID=2682091 RepID=A0A6I4I7M8_9SPHI|nr:hypothetical protein [Mucilaginibacter ginkgonis]QQL49072.1 hypothetical protein GO620_012920 [Mucilaginibacter ginkgonis]
MLSRHWLCSFVLATKEPKMPSQRNASFGARAFALQNILQALITQVLSSAKYLSPKLRADGEKLYTKCSAALGTAADTGPWLRPAQYERMARLQRSWGNAQIFVNYS